MKITKNMESKYFKGVDEKILNCREGYRVINVKFENTEDFENESAGEEYIICLEKFLNTECNLDYFMEDGSRSVIANVAEVSLCVLEEDIKNFNNWYKIFKNTYKYEMLKQREELERESELTDLETLENLEDENFGYTEDEIAKLEEECGFLDSEEIVNTMNGLQDELESAVEVPTVNFKSLVEFNIAESSLRHEFNVLIANNHLYKDEISKIEEKYYETQRDVIDTLFCVYIGTICFDWVHLNIKCKKKVDYVKLIDVWKDRSINDYKLSKRIVWGEVTKNKKNIMSKEQLYTNIENLVNNHDFDSIIGFYDKGGWLTEVRDRGTNILFIVDEKLSIYLNKDEKFDDVQGWIDFIKDNA